MVMIVLKWLLATGKECSLGAFERASQSSTVSQVDYIVNGYI